jgi:hypothetical protein
MRVFTHSFRGIIIAGLALVAGVGIFRPAGADMLADFRAEIARELSWFHGETERDLQEFREERDRLFAEFLEEQWKEFEEFAGLIADRTPKPVLVPKAGERPNDAVTPAGRKIEPPSPPAAPLPVAPALPLSPEMTRPNPEPVPPLAPSPAQPSPPSISLPGRGAAPAPPAPSLLPGRETATPPARPAGILGENAVEFEFFGMDLRIEFDPLLKTTIPLPPSNQGIATFWKQASTADFPPLVSRLLELQESFQLNDWGYYQLTMAVAERIQPQSHDATLLCWFLLAKSGYRVKVGFNSDRICLIVPAAHKLYGVPYYNLEGTRYYNFSYLRDQRHPGRLFTYKENYPGADNQVGLHLKRTPVIRDARTTRMLAFRYSGEIHQVPVAYNPNIIRFLATYPQTDLAVFFTAAVDPDAEQSLLAGLGQIIAGKSETEAINMLLRFVQTAFEYQTDDEQFGHEKYFFVEETIHLPFSDCEDRSILFSYLVRRLTGLEVIALHYPGHIATAVRFSSEVPGDYVVNGGNRYVVCDPTYINADIGMVMPQFKGVTPEVIIMGM